MRICKKSATSKEPSNTRLNPYDPLVKAQMISFYNLLSEKDKRLYAAAEAIKLPYGRIVYIASLFGCDRKTISSGIDELKNPGLIEKDRDRKKGGGRKLSINTIPGINEAFLAVVYNHTAGDPMDERIRWTNLTHQQIVDKLKEEGIEVSKKIVKQLFKKHGYVKRAAQKVIGTGTCKYRNEQFEIIAGLRIEYQEAGNPIISIDTKKKELIGNLYRDGKLYTLEVQKVFDHDFPHLADGIIIPHGIYDITKNKAYINIGTSKDTGEFACDSIRQWWYNQGRYDYPKATSILIFCDSGGSNSYRHYIFKEDLQKLVDEIGVEIRVAHYPSYASKWNPIEHRVFCHVTRALKGVILKGYDLVKELIETTTTKKGLTVKANIINKVYQTKRKVADNFKETMRIIFDKELGKWNYRAIPLTI
jgi:DNA-binding GntR family transcriptional regulator